MASPYVEREAASTRTPEDAERERHIQRLQNLDWVPDTYVTPPEKESVRYAIAAIEANKELREALEASNRALIAERDTFYDSVTAPGGNIPEDEDRAALAELDAIINANRTALRTQGGGR